MAVGGRGDPNGCWWRREEEMEGEGNLVGDGWWHNQGTARLRDRGITVLGGGGGTVGEIEGRERKKLWALRWGIHGCDAAIKGDLGVRRWR